MLDILVVDDEPPIREFVEAALRDLGHRVRAASDGAEAMACLDHQVFDVAILDVRLPKVDGFRIFRRLQAEVPRTNVILMTAYGQVSDAVAAMREKAADYLTKPFDLDDLLERVERIAEQRRLQIDLAGARDQLERLGPRAALIGQSPPMVSLRERIDAIAASDAAVLISGETGTGKELVANLIHHRSARAARALIAVNCAAFPQTLLEAELFGHERGAFTGAFRRRDGRFKAADGGTLFLDEIGDVPMPSQVKLLRTLEEGAFEPLGTNSAMRVDVRVISATNKDLRTLMQSGDFREDLFYRLKVFHLQIPPLRERRADLPLLVEHFRTQLAPSDPSPVRITPRAWAALSHYGYPGNVRELQHAMQHAFIMAGDQEIDLSHLPEEISGIARPVPAGAGGGSRPGSSELRPLAAAIKEFEREYLQRALQATLGNRTRAAELLGISRKSLWAKLKDHDLSGTESAD
jgi:DNA-binding NtrC family response regulator